MRWISPRFVMLIVGLWPGCLASAAAADAVLPGTNSLTIERPLDEVMVEGMKQFCLRELAASRPQPATRRKRDFSSEEAGVTTTLPHRKRFQSLIGTVDPHLTAGTSGRQRFELLSYLFAPECEIPEWNLASVAG